MTELDITTFEERIRNFKRTQVENFKRTVNFEDQYRIHFSFNPKDKSNTDPKEDVLMVFSNHLEITSHFTPTKLSIVFSFYSTEESFPWMIDTINLTLRKYLSTNFNYFGSVIKPQDAYIPNVNRDLK